MPARSLRPCVTCGKATLNLPPYCDTHQDNANARAREFDKARAQTVARSLYKTAQWSKLRRYALSLNPLCVYCAKTHRVALATVVDHIIPHKGDIALFYDPHNLQCLCKKCHDSTKAREEANMKRQAEAQ
jgi:5-methylcytosine-specific restriction enzyme A